MPPTTVQLAQREAGDGQVIIPGLSTQRVLWVWWHSSQVGVMRMWQESGSCYVLSMDSSVLHWLCACIYSLYPPIALWSGHCYYPMRELRHLPEVTQLPTGQFRTHNATRAGHRMLGILQQGQPWESHQHFAHFTDEGN